MRRWGLLVVCLVLSPALARAQDDDEARQLYARGTQLATTEQRCGDAIEFFRRAIAIHETPQRVLSLGACLAATGQHVEAITTFAHYLGSSGLSAADRQAARHALEDERRAVGTLALTVAPASAEIFVDGVLREGTGEHRTFVLDPGSRAIEVRAEGFVSQRAEVSALPGSSQQLTVTLEQDRGSAPQIAIDSDRSEAVISIDGQIVGTGTYSGGVSEGRHTIDVRAPGFADFHESIEARYGETVRVNARLGATTGSGENLAESPILWTIVGVVVVGAAVGIGVGIAVSQPQVHSGSTGVILMGLASF